VAYRNQAVSITYNTLKLRQVIRRPVARPQMSPLLKCQVWRTI